MYNISIHGYIFRRLKPKDWIFADIPTIFLYSNHLILSPVVTHHPFNLFLEQLQTNASIPAPKFDAFLNKFCSYITLNKCK